VFRTVGDQCSLWESVLPEELQRLPEELARVDALLDDPAFFTPFVPFFDPRIGRPSTPMETRPRELVEAAVDEVSIRLTAPRAAHQREGHERFTLDRILAEEKAASTSATPAIPHTAMGQRRRHRGALTGPEARRGQHRGLTLADPTAVRAGRGGQDHLDARPRARRASPPQRRGAGAGAHRQGRRRRSARRCGRRGLHDRQSPSLTARQQIRAQPCNIGDCR
jgi:hypothetical protein